MKGYIPDIIEEVKSGIIHIVHVVDRVDEKDEKYRERVSSGTGFMVNGYLVTNYHVINIEGSDKNSYIVLRTHDINPPIETEKTIYLYKELEGIKVYRNEGGFFTTETGNDTDDYCDAEYCFIDDDADVVDDDGDCDPDAGDDDDAD